MTNAVAQPDLFHSPGEWHFDGPPHNHIVWCGPEQRVCFLTSDGPSTANARLIAAAPDLLFALQGLYDDQVDYLTLNKLGGMDNHWMKAARAALEKARG